jgi:hypothetical protein
VGPVVLKPDITILKADLPVAVLDAKWKRPSAVPEAADLHQIIAYATVTGARDIGLVYSGRRFARKTIELAQTHLRISLVRVCVIGTRLDCEKSIGRLSRAIQRRRPGDAAQGVENPHLAT